MDKLLKISIYLYFIAGTCILKDLIVAKGVAIFFILLAMIIDFKFNKVKGGIKNEQKNQKS